MSEWPKLPAAPRASSPGVRAAMQGNRRHDTKPELAIRSLLHRAGFRYRTHVRPLPELRCEADIVFPRQRVVVFVDGCFWHGCPEHGRRPARNSGYWSPKIARNIARDQRNDAALGAAGWRVLRFWEHEQPETVVDAVASAVRGHAAHSRAS